MTEPLAEDVPFEVSSLDKKRVVVRFAEYVDHRRTRDREEELTDLVRRHSRIACDLRETKEVDSDWLALLADLSVEARDSGKRVALVGLNEALKTSADVLGLSDALEFCSKVDEVWR